jgi:hypothetical protein
MQRAWIMLLLHGYKPDSPFPDASKKYIEEAVKASIHD